MFQPIKEGHNDSGGKFHDHLRYIHKDTYSSNGSPDIIVRAPEEENSSEKGTIYKTSNIEVVHQGKRS